MYKNILENIRKWNLCLVTLNHAEASGENKDQILEHELLLFFNFYKPENVCQHSHTDCRHTVVAWLEICTLGHFDSYEQEQLDSMYPVVIRETVLSVEGMKGEVADDCFFPL